VDEVDMMTPVTPADPVLLSVVQLSDDAIFTLDGTSAVISWSDAAHRLFGRSARDALGESLPALFPEHLRADVRAALGRVATGEVLRHFESEVVRSDGLPTRVWLSMVACAERTEGARGVDGPSGGDRSCGEDEGVGVDGWASIVVIVRDVTEQHLTQAALAEVESRLQEGEELSHVGSWLWDLRTGTVQWSIEFHRIHGIDPFDFDGTFAFHLGMIHPDDLARVHAAMTGAVTGAEPLECRYRIVRPDGEIRLLHVRAQPAIGSAGTPVGLRGIGQDVTDGVGRPVSPDRPGS
jgi:PAS domain S-box-containing protein